MSRYRRSAPTLVAIVLFCCVLGYPPSAQQNSTGASANGFNIALDRLVALVNSSTPSSDLLMGQFCGGVVLNPTTVVTADHCVLDRPHQTIDVVQGVQDLCSVSPGEITRTGVAKIDRLVGPGQDLAVLHLADELRPPAHDVVPERSDEGSRLALAAGWGRESFGGVPRCGVRIAQLQVIEPSACDVLPSTQHLATVDYLCTVPYMGSENTCDGDSGGPVAVLEDGALVDIAVTMSGAGCGPDAVGLNIRMGDLLVPKTSPLRPS